VRPRELDRLRLHHAAETRFHHLRLLRALDDPRYRPEDEAAVLDEMEALWLAMSPAEQRTLEEQRSALGARSRPHPDTRLPAR
jgi:hypothetical protein